MSAGEERAARNEALFRAFNERVADMAHSEGASLRLEFVCECDDIGCLERLELTRAVYEEVRSNPRQFVVAPGHEHPEIERVVASGEGYLVVEKRDEAADIAREHDPRS